MPRTWREKLAPHIYRDAYGIDTIVQFRKQTSRERWPLDADWDELQRWIARALAELHDRAADAGTVRPSRTVGTLTADVETFLKTRKGRPGYAADKCHLKAWTALFRNGNARASRPRMSIWRLPAGDKPRWRRRPSFTAAGRSACCGVL
jgi:hypothetical protein